VMRKWDERKLAYDIERKSRGTYILCYFKADTQRIAGIEKDVQLSEKVMRVLILGTEKRPAEMIEQDIAGLPKQQPVLEERPAEAARERPGAPGAGGAEQSEPEVAAEAGSPEQQQ